MRVSSGSTFFGVSRRDGPGERFSGFGDDDFLTGMRPVEKPGQVRFCLMDIDDRHELNLVRFMDLVNLNMRQGEPLVIVPVHRVRPGGVVFPPGA
jgi:hypothetical protein